MRGLAFWTAAVIVSAAIAYAFAISGVEDDPAPEDDLAATAAQETASEPPPEEDDAPAAEAPPPTESDEDIVFSQDDTTIPEALDAPPEEPVEAPVTDDEAAEEIEDGGVEIGVLAVNELPFDAECGMHLRPVGERDVIFATGISLDPEAAVPAALLLNGELVVLQRIEAEGGAIGYSQYPRQVYRDGDTAITVAVDIAVEENLLGDWAQVTDGQMTITRDGQAPTEMAVGGRVGC